MSEEKERNDKDLEIEIKTARGDWKTSFQKTTKIIDVMHAVIKHFNFAQGGKYDIRLETKPNNPLEPERTLASYGIKDGDVLIFTDLGVGV